MKIHGTIHAQTATGRPRRARSLVGLVASSALAWLAASAPAAAQLAEPDRLTCQTRPTPGTEIRSGAYALSGGMAGDGWDGAGQNPVTITWHVENSTSDLGAAQRTAMINAMQAWANVVDITFQEIHLPNNNVSIDIRFATLDHSANELAEAGDPDCPFDGAGGTLGHAAFPPGVNSTCGGVLSETFTGNVHFDDAETWELDNGLGAGPDNLTWVACHEIGHALGLVHSNPVLDPNDIMAPTVGSNAAFPGLSLNDIANIRVGYAAGVGSVNVQTTMFVDESYTGPESGGIIQPFNTMTEAETRAAPYGAIEMFVEAGTYSEGPLTLNEGYTINALNGTVVIN